MNILICDDVFSCCKQIQEYLVLWSEKRSIGLTCDCAQNADEVLSRLAQGVPMDLLVLDIDLGETSIDGVTLAEKIRETQKDLPLLFLSGMKSRVREGYRLGAVGFLYKPIAQEELEFFLDRVWQQQNNESRSCIMVESGNRLVKVRVMDIVYLEAMEREVYVHTTQERLILKKQFSECLSALPQSMFAQIHRSYAVNHEYVSDLFRSRERRAVLTVGARSVDLPIGRSFLKRFIERNVQYELRRRKQ